MGTAVECALAGWQYIPTAITTSTSNSNSSHVLLLRLITTRRVLDGCPMSSLHRRSIGESDDGSAFGRCRAIVVLLDAARSTRAWLDAPCLSPTTCCRTLLLLRIHIRRLLLLLLHRYRRLPRRPSARGRHHAEACSAHSGRESWSLGVWSIDAMMIGSSSRSIYLHHSTRTRFPSF